jgi:hypothetical protein
MTLAIESSKTLVHYRFSTYELIPLAVAIVFCRVGGGALNCSCAGLRPPHKLDVQFSRIQLS